MYSHAPCPFLQLASVCHSPVTWRTLCPKSIPHLAPHSHWTLSHLSDLGSLVYSSVRPTLTYTLALGETLCYLPWKDPPLLQWAYFSLLRFTNVCDYLLNICHYLPCKIWESRGQSVLCLPWKSSEPSTIVMQSPSPCSYEWMKEKHLHIWIKPKSLCCCKYAEKRSCI